MTETSAALTYSSYLALDQVLDAQHPRSDEHDELLFIVVHQVYELWFKQLLHELGHLQERLAAGDTPRVLGTQRRILTVLKVAVAQIDVLETMTPLQFMGFRGRLDASSGFQSAQFRELEAVLGRRDDKVLDHYPTGSGMRHRVESAMRRPSVWDSFLAYLATQGYPAPSDRDVTATLTPTTHAQDLLVRVYADDGEPAWVAEHLVDLDEGLMEWRYRHVKMVERTIGARPGTGGSPGAAYLRTTLSKPMFPDLWEIRSRL